MATGDVPTTTRLAALPTSSSCGGCGTQLAPSLRACPGCGALLHAAELEALAARAERAENAGDLRGAASAWRDALALLPPAAPQRAAVAARLDTLTRRLDAAPAASRPTAGGTSGSAARGAWGTVAAVGLVLATKGKLLLLGLTKASTLFSMLAFLGVYWQLYGWGLAAGLVVSIYVHEMGHVAAITRYGMQASAPMFIPGFGAFVRSSHAPATAREDARVGLAGPLWGLAAALVAYALYVATGLGVWGAIAQLGAWLNLLNLTPVWQLDGARGFRALSRRQRWTITALLALGAPASGQKMLWVVALGGAWSAYHSLDDAPGERRTLLAYLGLAAALTVLMGITGSVVPR